MRRRIIILRENSKPATKEPVVDLKFFTAFCALIVSITLGVYIVVNNNITSKYDSDKNKLLAENDSLKEDIIRYQAIIKNDSVESQNNVWDYINNISVNTAPNDLPTLTVANASITPTSPGYGPGAWVHTINIRPADVAAAQIYIHNCTEDTLRNVSLFMRYEYSADHKIALLSAWIRSQNIDLRVGFAEMVSKKAIEIIPDTSAAWFNHGSSHLVHFRSDSLFTDSGLRIKDVKPGWPGQGVLVTNFKVQEFKE